jgi:hypothetical protein
MAVPKAITGATNASPIVITIGSHGYSTGDFVTIASVGGNTDANGEWQITVINANSFSLDGSSGNDDYTSGGTATLLDVDSENGDVYLMRGNSTTTGAGDLVITANVTGYIPISYVEDDTQIEYRISIGDVWESGIGRYDHASNSLVREFVLENSDETNQFISFGAGTKVIEVTSFQQVVANAPSPADTQFIVVSMGSLNADARLRHVLQYNSEIRAARSGGRFSRLLGGSWGSIPNVSLLGNIVAMYAMSRAFRFHGVLMEGVLSLGTAPYVRTDAERNGNGSTLKLVGYLGMEPYGFATQVSVWTGTWSDVVIPHAGYSLALNAPSPIPFRVDASKLANQESTVASLPADIFVSAGEVSRVPLAGIASVRLFYLNWFSATSRSNGLALPDRIGHNLTIRDNLVCLSPISVANGGFADETDSRKLDPRSYVYLGTVCGSQNGTARCESGYRMIYNHYNRVRYEDTISFSDSEGRGPAILSRLASNNWQNIGVGSNGSNPPWRHVHLDPSDGAAMGFVPPLCDFSGLGFGDITVRVVRNNLDYLRMPGVVNQALAQVNSEHNIGRLWLSTGQDPVEPLIRNMFVDNNIAVIRPGINSYSVQAKVNDGNSLSETRTNWGMCRQGEDVRIGNSGLYLGENGDSVVGNRLTADLVGQIFLKVTGEC